MSRYISRHTGATIDDAIARALPGGAIDITLAKKTDGERRNYENVGGAVGWYRICIGGTRYDKCRAIVSLTHIYAATGASDLLLDVNTDVDVKGLRCLAYSGKGSSSPIVTKARVVDLPDYKQAIDVYYNTASNDNRWVIGIVNLGNGTFSIQTPTFVAADDTLPDGETLIAPMEWENPPMALNVEYRTTERYHGKPVYVKDVNCGVAPETGYIIAYPVIDNIESVIEAVPRVGSGTLPTIMGSQTNYEVVGAVQSYQVDNKYAKTVIEHNGDTTNSVFVRLRYTKTTD